MNNDFWEIWNNMLLYIVSGTKKIGSEIVNGT